jgi:hypothetical protein
MATLDAEEEDVANIDMSGAWGAVSNALGHLNGVIFTAIIVLAAVVAYIIYIIHLYDSGKLGGERVAKNKRFSYGASERAARNKKYASDDSRWGVPTPPGAYKED